MIRYVTAASLLVLATIGAWLGYSLVRSDVESRIYQARLRDLASENAQLIERYNEAVRQTAVTELDVHDGALSVRIRDAQGQEQILPTPYDPRGEIYVDYVVLNGRLWIRRIFDENTAPSKALVIDPALAGVDWSDSSFVVGKAVYRALGEGRWVVTVTGDGSLGLARCDGERSYELEPAPQVRDFETIEREIAGAVDDIGIGEALREVVGGN